MKLERKNCPHCDKKLPLMLFTANRKLGIGKECIFFTCPNCSNVVKAISNDEHQKNFLWIFLVPLFATPIIFSMKAFIADRFLGFYYLFSYGLSLIVPTVLGQHKMDFLASSKEEFEKESAAYKNTNQQKA